MKRLCEDSPGLPALLPYESCEGNIFENVDGSMGAVWRLSAKPTELASDEDLGELAARLAGLFRQLPEGAVCQFMLLADRELRSTFEDHAAGGQVSGLFGDLNAATARALTDLDLRLEGIPFRARRLQYIFTLKLRGSPPHAPAWLYLVKPGEFGERHAHARRTLRSRLAAVARTVEDFFLQADLHPCRLGERDLQALCGWILNPKRGAPPPGRRTTLRERMVQSHLDFKSREGIWHLDGIPHALVSVVDLPTETVSNMLSTMTRLVPEGITVLNIEVPDQASIRRGLKAKKKLAFCQDRSGEADLASIRGEIDGVLGEMFGQGTRVIRARIHFWLRAPNQVGEICDAVLNGLQSLGLGAVREGPLALSLALQCLPLAYDPANDGAVKRGRTLKDLNLAHLLPACGGFAGTRRKDLTLLNRLGEVVSFSFFEGDVAPHGIVCGVSGSGKSVLSNNFIIHARRRGARVFVLDRGRSYWKIASVLGGKFVRFDSDLCINPCGSSLDGDKLVFLTDLFSEMATAGRTDLGMKERSLLSQALRAAFARTKEEVTVSHVCNALSEMEHPSAADLALCLKLYTRSGPYGELFEGPGQLDASDDFLVFELERVAMNKEIASVVLMAILQRITDACMRDPDVEKLLIIDEAWTLLQSPATARFLENVFRTYRKYRACAVMVTQQVSDFDGPAGAAIRANAPNRCYLRQTPETILAMEKLLDLKPAEKRVLSTLRTLKGAFSEILFLTPRESGVGRLVQDPMTYWITTTDAEDNAALDDLKARCGSLRDALQAASMRYPGGVQATRDRHE